MKVLVATARTQGTRTNDYHYCVDGELVWFPPTCSRDEADPDGGCGCGRGFGGLNSHTATTTAMVTEVALSRDDYIEALWSSLERQGWTRFLEIDEVAAEVDALLVLVADLPVGTVLGRRLDQVVVRAQSATR